jgi:hypothetical protein
LTKTPPICQTNSPQALVADSSSNHRFECGRAAKVAEQGKNELAEGYLVSWRQILRLSRSTSQRQNDMNRPNEVSDNTNYCRVVL